MALLNTKIAHHVMTITLVDEERRNVLSRQLLIELMDAIDVVDNNPDIRVAVVTNSGNVFCAGADLSERSSTALVGGRTVEISEIFQRIQNSPKPFVGLINGHCVAGGVGLAAVMDISIALDTAMFGFTEVRVGVAPAMISVVCLPKMCLADTKSAFLRGNRFSANEAARMGLINDVADADDLDDELTRLLNDLLAGEPAALAAAKRLTVHVPTLTSDDAFEWTTKLSAQLFASDNAKEGMAAFLEKRPASWVRSVGVNPD
jgi:methylglutaconyl-CoA hydratase